MQAMHGICSCDVVTLEYSDANGVCQTLAGIKFKDGNRLVQPALFYLCIAEYSILCCTKRR